MWLVGNIIAFISSIFLYRSLLCTNKKDMLKYQIIECIIYSIACIFLLAYSGLCTYLISFIIIWLEYHKKNSVDKTIILSIILVIISIIFNNQGVLGYTPVIASLVYTYTLLCTENMIAIQTSLSLNAILWIVYTVIIKDIPTTISTLIQLILNIYGIVRGKRNNIQAE